MKLARRIVLILTLALSAQVFAQGEGARVYLHAPTGINVVSLTYMDMSSNINFAGDIVVPGVDISSDVFALNYNRFFTLGGRFAEVWATGIFGTINPAVFTDTGEILLSPEVSGFADPYLALRVGLIGAPALAPAGFAKHVPEFQVYALAGVTLPIGEYDSSQPLNLGTNRWSLRLGVPMVIPFGRATFLEVVPSLYLYGENDDVYGGGSRDQAPLFVTETHLTHNFTPKFWAGLDLRYQSGGETETNGVKDDNKFGQLGGGATAGFQFNRSLSAWVSYGEIFGGGDDVNGEMLRFRFVAVF